MVSPRRVLLRWGQERKNEKKKESRRAHLSLSVYSPLKFSLVDLFLSPNGLLLSPCSRPLIHEYFNTPFATTRRPPCICFHFASIG